MTNNDITIEIDTPNGPVVEYSAEDSAEAVEAAAAPHTVDWETPAYKLTSGRFRSPLVVRSAGESAATACSAKYTYRIFDANPNSSSCTAWDTHLDIEIECDSDEAAIDEVRDVMRVEAAGLNADDGYDVGQLLYAIVWDADGVIVGAPTYEITAEDLGVTAPEPMSNHG